MTMLPIKEPAANPCSCCPRPPTQAPLDKVIAVGFGCAQATRDGECVADGEVAFIVRNGQPERVPEWSLTFQDIEDLASLDPDHDWRIELNGPLHGETYQRQGPGVWVCIETNKGFA